MRPLATLFAAAFTAALLHAQAPVAPWDAPTRARGWAYCDVDGSFLFLEPLRQEFMHWDLSLGLLGSRPAPSLEERRSRDPDPTQAEDPYLAAARLLYGEVGSTAKRKTQLRKVFPDRWLIDPKDHCWATAGSTLLESDRRGVVLTQRSLPAAATDMVRVRDGFFLCYRTLNPYVQKFDWRGEVVWTYQRKGAAPVEAPLHRIVANSDDTVLLAEMGGLSFSVLGPGASGQIYFTRGGAIAEPLSLGRQGRATMAYCPTRNAVLAVFSEAEGRAELADGKGLALACFHLAKGTLDWRSTGLGEGHQLVGVTSKGAVFTTAAGGLAVVPLP